jgi:hypothetical protein
MDLLNFIYDINGPIKHGLHIVLSKLTYIISGLIEMQIRSVPNASIYCSVAEVSSNVLLFFPLNVWLLEVRQYIYLISFIINLSEFHWIRRASPYCHKSCHWIRIVYKIPIINFDKCRLFL